MTPEQQRIAIAEWCGWTDIIFRGILRPHEKDYAGHHPNLTPPGSSGRWQGTLPDYLNDLNAMHEAEKTIIDGEHECVWIGKLSEVTGANIHSNPTLWAIRLAHATATQRAEALLRTIGKWENSEIKGGQP